jgi:cytochrome c-type biogenesis protein CcmH/NrfG
MIVVVVTFVVHSAVDWVYFIPGEALIALLCAGWVAGRGPWQEPLEPGERSLARLTRSPLAAAGAATAIALALVVAWSQWQPLRSEQAATAGANELGNANTALISDNRALVKRDLAAARADELTAIARDPLDITPRADLAGAYNTAGELGLAQRTLERAVQLQPSNAVSWFDLWQFDSGITRYAKIADQALAVTYHLNPYDPGLDESLGASG